FAQKLLVDPVRGISGAPALVLARPAVTKADSGPSPWRNLKGCDLKKGESLTPLTPLWLWVPVQDNRTCCGLEGKADQKDSLWNLTGGRKSNLLEGRKSGTEDGWKVALGLLSDSQKSSLVVEEVELPDNMAGTVEQKPRSKSPGAAAEALGKKTSCLFAHQNVNAVGSNLSPLSAGSPSPMPEEQQDGNKIMTFQLPLPCSLRGVFVPGWSAKTVEPEAREGAQPGDSKTSELGPRSCHACPGVLFMVPAMGADRCFLLLHLALPARAPSLTYHQRGGKCCRPSERLWMTRRGAEHASPEETPRRAAHAPSFPAPVPDAAAVAMLMPKKNRIAIYELLFKEGVMVAKKDVHMPKHPELADKNVPNLHVMKAMQSLKSRGFVKEQFAWRHFYWYLTNEGIQYLRDYLHLPPEIVPATLRRSRPETGRPRPKGVLHVCFLAVPDVELHIDKQGVFEKPQVSKVARAHTGQIIMSIHTKLQRRSISLRLKVKPSSNSLTTRKSVFPRSKASPSLMHISLEGERPARLTRGEADRDTYRRSAV
ncbi:40S ribosomal protein S10, partial [Galemys pyrenaicus]